MRETFPVLMCLVLAIGLIAGVATPAAALTDVEAEPPEETVDLSEAEDVPVVVAVTDNREGHDDQIILIDEDESDDVWASLVESSNDDQSVATSNPTPSITDSQEAMQVNTQNGTAIAEEGSAAVLQEVEQAADQDSTTVVAGDLNEENATTIENGNSTVEVEQEAAQVNEQDGESSAVGDNESATVDQASEQATEQATVIRAVGNETTVAVVQLTIQSNEQDGHATAEGENVTAEVTQTSSQQSDQFANVGVAGENTTLVVAQVSVQLNEQAAFACAIGENATADVSQINTQESDQTAEILSVSDDSEIVVLQESSQISQQDGVAESTDD